MSVQKDENLSPPASPAKEPWETPSVVESAIKDNTAYTSTPHDDIVIVHLPS